MNAPWLKVVVLLDVHGGEHEITGVLHTCGLRPRVPERAGVEDIAAELVGHEQAVGVALEADVPHPAHVHWQRRERHQEAAARSHTTHIGTQQQPLSDIKSSKPQGLDDGEKFCSFLEVAACVGP